jgi:hypothetical protein
MLSPLRVTTLLSFDIIKVDYVNEKDSPTVDLTVRPLSGSLTASPLLNRDGGSKVKISGNLGDFTLFNCLSAH